MAVNALTFNQLATVLNQIVSQATGTATITPTNTGEFVSVAQTGLLTGYDPLTTAISQVISRTIFSIRPYYRKFSGLIVDEITYGNHVRKLTPIDKPWEADARFTLTDGQSVDQYTVNKPAVLQTNFYGENVFQKSLTIYRDQLDNAFRGPDEFGSFLAMVMQNVSDMIEQAHESVARATIANFIGGKISGDKPNVIHLVTEYNTVTGLELTSSTVKAPANFVPFVKWMYGRIKTVSDMLTERTTSYHINVTNQLVSRHTPRERQRLYLSAIELNNIETSVLSSIFHDNFLNLGDYEAVSYWQAVKSPYSISLKPTYMLPTGLLTTPETAVTQDNILGVIMDEEAAGITVVNQWSATTPLNAKGGYTNWFWHFTDRYWNDFTENGVVLLLD